MTPIFCCGFECGIVGSDLGQHWHILAGTPTISTTTVRSASRSLRINPSAATMAARTPVFTSSANLVIRFYLRFASLPTADCNIMLIQTIVSGITFESSDSKIYLSHSNGATRSTEGITVTTNTWYRIDYSYDGTGVQNMKVDGVAVNQLTGGNTGNGAQIYFGNSGVSNTADFFIDDVLICNNAADYPIGAGYINHFIPTSDGTHNVAGTGDFQRTVTGTDILNATTTAFQLVDDVPMESGASVDWINMLLPVNATDYVECIFGPAAGISVPTVGPRAVEVIAGIHQAGTGAGNMQIRLNDNGTMGTVYSATGIAGVTAVNYKRAHFGDPPSAASVWNANNDGSDGDFRDLRVRFGSPAALDVNPDQYFDCIMIEAEFAEIAALFPDAFLRNVEQPYFQKRMVSSSGQKNNAVKP